MEKACSGGIYLLCCGVGDYALSLWPGTWQVPRKSLGKRAEHQLDVRDLGCEGDSKWEEGIREMHMEIEATVLDVST